MPQMVGAQVVVTGANGFIGRWLVRELFRRGAHVRALARRPEAAHGLFADAVEVQPLDLGNTDRLTQSFAGADVVFHAAGLYCFGLGHQRSLNETNILGTARVLEAAVRARVHRIVHLSSASVLDGRSHPQSLTHADDFPRSRPRFSPYKASKWEAERIVLEAAARGAPAVIGSIPCPLGAEDTTPTPTGRMVHDFVRGRFHAYTHTGLNFIGIHDLTDGLIAVAERGTPGQRYILGQENLLLSEFLQRLARWSHFPAPTVEIPWPVLACVGALGELAHLTSPHASRRLCLETALQARHRQFFCLRRTHDELGWAARRPLDAALQESIAWFRGISTGTPAPVIPDVAPPQSV
jgi:dihydroflavonol-4-reductase